MILMQVIYILTNPATTHVTLNRQLPFIKILSIGSSGSNPISLMHLLHNNNVVYLNSEIIYSHKLVMIKYLGHLVLSFSAYLQGCDMKMLHLLWTPREF